MSSHIECIETGVQLGSERFPSRFDQPQIKQWRCELTALSRLYNLYFVACDDTIHVYRPSFPDQRLSREADLILRPPVSYPDLEPGIDLENPHSITRILVDYLGNDEVILITCDDGDVVGYRVEAIQHAMEQRTRHPSGTQELGNQYDVKVFLHRNVGASAWGLALHRDARMIAISANTHKVTVLAYALSDGPAPCDIIDSSERLPHDAQEVPDFPAPRRKDHVFVLHAQHNIPAVSFDNGGDDPSGRWLFSSSITGEATLWDLHQPQEPARVIQVGHCASAMYPFRAPTTGPGGCSCLRPRDCPHAVWGVMFLNPRLAYENPNSDETESEPQNPTSCFHDLSKQKNCFTVRSGQFDSSTEDLVAEDLSEVSSVMAISDAESVVSESSSLDEEPVPRTNHPSAMDHCTCGSDTMSVDSAEQQNISSEDEEDVREESQQEHSHGVPPESQDSEDSLFVAEVSAQPPIPAATGNNAINPSGAWSQPLGDSIAAIMWGDSDDESDSEEDDFLPSTAQAHMAWASIVRPTRPYCEVTTAPSFKDQAQLSAPCLIITKDDLFLFQRPFDSAGDTSDPIIMIRRPLHPPGPGHPWTLPTSSSDRQCYSAEIPELGIFIVASPYGRAGIFSLTWRKEKDQERPTHSLVLEQILPFSRHNRNEVWDVPHTRLIGVAVGPVQGMFDSTGDQEDGRAPQSRRWRLLMYYTDHTVLSYEVSKRRTTESPDISELVV